MYSMLNEITFTQAGADNRLKLDKAVSLMMDCCQFQEYQETNLRKYLTENSIAIFLSSLQIDIVQMPEFRDQIRTTVKIYGCKSIYGLRRLTMHDDKGALRLIANATGAFFDLKNQKAVKIDPAEFQIGFDEAEPMETLPRKIVVPAGITPDCGAAPVTIKPSELDPNGHLTSPEYFAIASDALPEKFQYDRVRIEYKKQVKNGDIIQPVLYRPAPDTIITVLSGADNTASAVLEFSTRANVKRSE